MSIISNIDIVNLQIWALPIRPEYKISSHEVSSENMDIIVKLQTGETIAIDACDFATYMNFHTSVEMCDMIETIADLIPELELFIKYIFDNMYDSTQKWEDARSQF